MGLSAIVLVLMLLSFANGFKYRRSNYLGCGQWGYIGNNYNPKNLEILGLYNQTRGEHSCGMYVDGEIIKGINEEKLWMDFIANNKLPAVLETNNKVFLGHARQASSGYGVHGWNQQHPFFTGNIIGQQNGTIRNDTALANKYKIERKDWSVDTELLYTIMDRHGYDVLEEYTGFAALMWVHADTPNELYIFRGISPHQHNDERYYEERPLFYLEEEGGVYFSSMENSLRYINPDDSEFVPQKVPANKVIKIRFDESGTKLTNELVREINRDLTKSVKYVYERTTPGKQEAPLGPRRVNGMGQSMIGKNTTTDVTAPLTLSAGAGTTGAAGTKITDKAALKRALNGHVFQTKTINPEKCYDEYVTFRNGRYFCKDQFINGAFRLTRTGRVVAPAKRNQVAAEGTVYYFFCGIMMRDREMWNKFCKEPMKILPDKIVKKQKHYFRRYAFHAFPMEPGWVIAMSYFSKYPVKVMDYNCGDEKFHEKWYYDGLLASDIVACPMYNDAAWLFLDGGLYGKRTKNLLDDGFDTRHVEDVKAEIDGSDSDEGDVDDADYVNSLRNCGDSCDVPSLKLEENINTPFEELDIREDIERQLVICWDRRISSVNGFLASLKIKELVALHFYIESFWNLNSQIKITPEEVRRTLILDIKGAIANKCSIREVVEHPGHGSLELKTDIIDMQHDLQHARYELVRELYNSDLLDAMKADIENYDEIEEEESVEEVEYEDVDEEEDDLDDEEETLVNAAEEVITCVNSMEEIQQDLDTYPDSEKLAKLSKIISENNSKLASDMKHFIEDELPEEEKLISKI